MLINIPFDKYQYFLKQIISTNPCNPKRFETISRLSKSLLMQHLHSERVKIFIFVYIKVFKFEK